MTEMSQCTDHEWSDSQHFSVTSYVLGAWKNENVGTLFEALGKRWSCTEITLQSLWLVVAMPIPLPSALLIFCGDLNEKDSWLVSFPFSSVSYTEKQAASLADCTGVICCLNYSRIIYSFEGKKNKQAKFTPALCLRRNGWVPSLPPPPCRHSPEFQGVNSQWRK